MMTRMHRLAACLLAIQGLAYTGAAAIVFDRLSLDALRFAGTGLGWIFLALLNLSSRSSAARGVVVVTIGANALAFIHLILLAVAAPSWPAAVGIVIIVICLAGSVTALRRPALGADVGGRVSPDIP
ncbi:MAG: hypothetical protein SYC29_08215 [Planctomycetota bacterium]|nr:hypothetical protein [Planctomycetota bacterium]